MQLSGGVLCKTAWKEVSGIFGEDSAEAGKSKDRERQYSDQG